MAQQPIRRFTEKQRTFGRSQLANQAAYNILDVTGVDPTGRRSSVLGVQRADAFLASEGGGALWWPPGDYLLDAQLSLADSDNIWWLGSGWDSQIIIAWPPTFTLDFKTAVTWGNPSTSRSFCGIQDMRIHVEEQVANANYGVTAFKLLKQNNCHIHNVLFTVGGGSFFKMTDLLLLEDCVDCGVLDCNFHETAGRWSNRTITFNNSSGCRLTDNCIAGIAAGGHPGSFSELGTSDWNLLDGNTSAGTQTIYALGGANTIFGDNKAPLYQPYVRNSAFTLNFNIEIAPFLKLVYINKASGAGNETLVNIGFPTATSNSFRFVRELYVQVDNAGGGIGNLILQDQSSTSGTGNMELAGNIDATIPGGGAAVKRMFFFIRDFGNTRWYQINQAGGAVIL